MEGVQNEGQGESLPKLIIDTVQRMFGQIESISPYDLRMDMDKEFSKKIPKYDGLCLKADCGEYKGNYRPLWIEDKVLKGKMNISKNQISCKNEDCERNEFVKHFTNFQSKIKSLYIIFKGDNINHYEEFKEINLRDVEKNNEDIELFATCFFFYYGEDNLIIFPIDESNNGIYNEINKKLNDKKISVEDLRLGSALYCTDKALFKESIITDLKNNLKPDEIDNDSNSTSRTNSSTIRSTDSKTTTSKNNPPDSENSSTIKSSDPKATTQKSEPPVSENSVKYQPGVFIEEENVVNKNKYEKSYSYFSRNQIKIFSYKLEHSRENQFNSIKCKCTKWNPKYVSKCLYCNSEELLRE